MDNTQNQLEIGGCKRRKLLGNDSADVSQAQEDQPNYFDTLPDEIHLIIMKRMPQLELDSVALVCPRFKRIIEDRSLWKKVVIKDRELEPCDIEKLMRRPVQHLTLRELSLPSLRPVLEATQPNWCLKEVLFHDVQTYPDNLARILKKCRQLRKVELRCIRMNNDVLLALSENEDLEYLCLRDLEQVPAGLVILLRNVRKLQEICILNCSTTIPMPTNDHMLNSICENLAPSLLHLILTCSTGDHHIELIVRNCPLLRSLRVYCDHEFTVRSTELLRDLKDLRMLDMLMNDLIPPEAFFDLATELENLVELGIICSSRDIETIREIEELFGVTMLEDHEWWRVGTFTTSFRVVKLQY